MTAMAVLLLLAGADATDAALAKDALAVLAKHCARCHGGAAPKAGFNVLERKALLAKHVVAGKPDASELVLRVEAGMMPPGTSPKPTKEERDLLRRWIAAGAPDVPPPPPVLVTGDDYVLGEIARDWAMQGIDARANARYLSLNHLLAVPDGPARVAAARKELARMLAAFTPDDAKPKLDAIDKQKSVFRLDLASIGWNRQPFVIPPAKKGLKPTPAALDLFDLVLLEYPYAVLSFKQPFLDALPFLQARAHVRPVAYVRGDWLLGLLADKRFGRELMRLLNKDEKAPLPDPAPKSVWGESVSLAAARAELGWKGTNARLAFALREATLGGLADGKDVSRAEWEARFPAVVGTLETGTALLPLDGLTAPSIVSDPSFTVKARTIRYELAVKDKGKVVKPARPGGTATVFKARKDPKAKPIEGLALLVEPSSDAILEVALRDHAEETDSMVAPTAATGSKEFALDNKGRGYEVTPPASEDHFLVIAAKGDDKSALPPGATHRAIGTKEKVRDRFIHPLYKLAEDGKGFARPLGPIVKATVNFKTVLEE